MEFPFESKKLNNKKEIPNWLIMSPSRASAEKVSIALTEYQIPHFFRNKPILNETPIYCKIRVQNIHISKVAEA
ncbi:hypothetical protein N9T38_02350 [SAR116 cluster bacterium]|nr:hypothetical protein [SAR116 cluster bacterium]